MGIIITFFQLILCLALLIAASVITFRPQIFKSLEKIIPQSRLWQILQAIFLWIVLLINLAGVFVPFVAFFASCFAILASIPLVIKATHLKDSKTWSIATALVLLPIIIGLGKPLGLKVILLPKADELTKKLSTARVVKTYDEGFWFEGITAGDDGTLYLSGNRNLDFSRNDYYHDGHGELIERKPNGSESILFKTPKGCTSGVPLIASDKSIYLTSYGEKSGIWRIDSNKKSFQIVEFPEVSWPNGLDQGPDGMLYTSDSNLGVIWRINPKSGKIEEAKRESALLARPFIALAPGANGLHFIKNDLYVTVSDQTTLLKYSVDDKGNIGKSSIVTKGVPGDDFAISKDGSFFITTHPYNTVVEVSPNGKRFIIAGMEQQIIGPTDAAFGKTENDSNTLYVVTDGGAFTGGPKTRGQLIALEPYGKK
ncbi:hypothetical protein N9R54_02560 [Pelobium sp.]|nr:hypothetical protein [Pelobium sp.]MDA9555096.1 hypothetical protein [Pelobium sp.]